MTNHEYAVQHGLQTVTGDRLDYGQIGCRSIVVYLAATGGALDTFSEAEFMETISEGRQAAGGLVINW